MTRSSNQSWRVAGLVTLVAVAGLAVPAVNPPPAAADVPVDVAFRVTAAKTGTNQAEYRLADVHLSGPGSLGALTVTWPAELQLGAFPLPPSWQPTDGPNSVSYIIDDQAVFGTIDQVEQFLRDTLAFRLAWPGVFPPAGAVISVQGSQRRVSTATINGRLHHYEYVQGVHTWTQAYNLAQQRQFCGLTGYLATITSQEEQDFIYGPIATDSGWLGGTRALLDHQRIQHNPSIPTDLGRYQTELGQETWYWANGPEALIDDGQGRVFYHGARQKWPDGQIPGRFSWFATNGQPDATGPRGAAKEYEAFLQFAQHGLDGRWNDLPNEPTSPDWPDVDKVEGYYVEYGGYFADMPLCAEARSALLPQPVSVEHVDEQGVALAPSDWTIGAVGSPYSWPPLSPPPAGLQYAGPAPGSAPASGVFEAVPQRVVHVYRQGTPGLSVAKTAVPAAVTAAGQTVTYAITVTNTGDTALSAVTVAEDFQGAGAAPAVACPAATLAAGAAMTCRAEYTVVAADLEQGVIANTAVARATAPGGAAVVAQASAEVVAHRPGLDLVVTPTPAWSSPTAAAAGDLVDYRVTATNSGTAPLAGVTVGVAGFTGTGARPAWACPAGAWPGPAGSLAPGESVTCAAAYHVTQADIDAGAIRLDAVAEGATPGCADASCQALAGAAVTVFPPAAPAVDLTKTGTVAGATQQPGDPVTYELTVTNAGAVTLDGVQVADLAFSGTGSLGPVICPPGWDGSLAVGESQTCRAVYQLTQADIDAGVLENTAEAAATGPGGDRVTARDGVTVPLGTSVGLSLAEAAAGSWADPAAARPGDLVGYSVTVRNTGGATLADVRVATDAFTGTGGPVGLSCGPWPGASGVLAPDEAVTCVASYPLTQADVDAGYISHRAAASGTPPGCAADDCRAGASDRARVLIPQAPALALAKTATPSDPASFVVGQVVDYAFRLVNTGNVTLGAAQVWDDAAGFTGSGSLSAVTCSGGSGSGGSGSRGGGPAALAPGAALDCAAAYTLTQADIDQGTVANVARASAASPLPPADPVFPGEPLPPAAADPAAADAATLRGASAPGLALAKTATPATVAAAGEQVVFRVTALNDGAVTLHDVAVADDPAGFTGHGSLGPLACPAAGSTWPGPPGVLAPGASVTCEAAYSVTLEDVAQGSIANRATATGRAPDGTAVTAEAAASVTALTQPGLALAKTASVRGGAAAYRLGDTVDYTFLVTNTGNVAVTGVAVAEDAFTGAAAAPAVTCPGGSLAPGASVTCTAAYTAVQADVDAGSLGNTAVATATAASGGAVTSASATATIAADQQPGLALVKAVAVPGGDYRAGDVIEYTFTVTNTGNVTLSAVGVVDGGALFGGAAPENLTPPACPAAAAALAPGAAVTCGAEYAATAADVAAGGIANEAYAVARTPTGSEVVSASAFALIKAVAELPQVGPPVGGTLGWLAAVCLLLGGAAIWRCRGRDPARDPG
ncbi:MAG: DUF11 domain-containing protein [Propionibacteriaceae bacterium]|jgi:uncharacterized repeat protein (TIGR01451 family)|nr:DUF11 domain-containing protein [Propionibacteriaceae bacterium]